MNLLDLYAKIIFDDSEYTEGLENANKKASNFGTTLKKGLVNAAQFAAGAIGAASTAVTALGKIAFDYNSEIESYVSNFTVMLGDAEKAAAKVEELKEMGAKTPFEMADLASATQTLLAFNVSGDKTTDVLQKLGDISLGNVSKMESLTRAYGKMNASQKVTLEDINMMIDAGFNPLLVVAENTGETMTDLYDRISKGEVAFSEIEQAIEQATSVGGQYYKGMETASQTTQGLISTLKDNAQALVGEVFTPITDGLTKKLLPAAIDAIEELSVAYEEHGIEGMIQAAGNIIGASAGELARNAPILVSSGVSLVESLVSGIRSNKDTIISGAGDTFFAFVDGISRLIPSLFGTAVDLVVGLGQYIIDNPDKVIESAGSLFGNFLIGLADAIPQLFFTAVEIVASLGEYILTNAPDILESAAQIGAQIVAGIWNGIVAGWDSLVSNFSWLVDGLTAGVYGAQGLGMGDTLVGVGLPTGGTSSGSSSGKGAVGPRFSNTVSGIHANGLDYVPYDGYLAELHRGEKVLTSSEAEAERKDARKWRPTNFIQYIYSEAKTAADLMQEAIYQYETAVYLGV